MRYLSYFVPGIKMGRFHLKRKNTKFKTVQLINDAADVAAVVADGQAGPLDEVENVEQHEAEDGDW